MLGIRIFGYGILGTICFKRPHEDEVVEVEVFKNSAHYVRERSKKFDTKYFFFLCTYIHSPSSIFFSQGSFGIRIDQASTYNRRKNTSPGASMGLQRFSQVGFLFSRAGFLCSTSLMAPTNFSSNPFASKPPEKRIQVMVNGCRCIERKNLYYQNFWTFL